MKYKGVFRRILPKRLVASRSDLADVKQYEDIIRNLGFSKEDMQKNIAEQINGMDSYACFLAIVYQEPLEIRAFRNLVDEKQRQGSWYHGKR
jgi:hypothetical protein